MMDANTLQRKLRTIYICIDRCRFSIQEKNTNIKNIFISVISHKKLNSNPQYHVSPGGKWTFFTSFTQLHLDNAPPAYQHPGKKSNIRKFWKRNISNEISLYMFSFHLVFYQMSLPDHQQHRQWCRQTGHLPSQGGEQHASGDEHLQFCLFITTSVQLIKPFYSTP